MHFAKRALLYIIRQRGKTASLFLLLFVTAVFLISCFSILRISEGLSKNLRASLGAAFYIRADTTLFVNEKGETELTKNSIRLSQKDVGTIMDMADIKYCNPVNYGFAKSDDLCFIPGEKDTEENNMGKVTALRFSALAPDFAEDTAVLAKGRHITDRDSRKILVSEQLAAASRLSVGDTVTLTHAKPGERNGGYVDEIPVKTAFVRAEIVGIYRISKPDTSLRPTAGIDSNTLYASLDVLDGLHESETGVYTGEVGFYITDPADLNSIIRNVRNYHEIDWTTHFIRTNDFQYSRIADRLSSLGNLMMILLACVSVVSTGVLTLFLTMRMRGRVREAGILLAAGIPKRQLLGQFLLEVLSVAAAALVLSSILSPLIIKAFEYGLFDKLQPHLLNEKTISEAINNDITGGAASTYPKLTGIETLLIYMEQSVTAAASTFFSSTALLRLTPKEILSKMS